MSPPLTSALLDQLLDQLLTGEPEINVSRTIAALERNTLGRSALERNPMHELVSMTWELRQILDDLRDIVGANEQLELIEQLMQRRENRSPDLEVGQGELEVLHGVDPTGTEPFRQQPVLHARVVDIVGYSPPGLQSRFSFGSSLGGEEDAPAAMQPIDGQGADIQPAATPNGLRVESQTMNDQPVNGETAPTEPAENEAADVNMEADEDGPEGEKLDAIEMINMEEGDAHVEHS